MENCIIVKEVQKVVQNVVEADDRSKNIIVFGLTESKDGDINGIIDSGETLLFAARWLHFAAPIWSRLASHAKICPSRFHFI